MTGAKRRAQTFGEAVDSHLADKFLDRKGGSTPDRLGLDAGSKFKAMDEMNPT